MISSLLNLVLLQQQWKLETDLRIFPCAEIVLLEVVGQYLLYRTILDTSGLSDDLYLAVPEMAFLGILGEELGRQIRLKTQMKILIFNPVAEEIIQWIA